MGMAGFFFIIPKTAHVEAMWNSRGVWDMFKAQKLSRCPKSVEL